MKYILYTMILLTFLAKVSAQQPKKRDFLAEAKKIITSHTELINALGDNDVSSSELLSKQKKMSKLVTSPYIRVPHDFTKEGRDSILSLSRYLKIIDETYPFFKAQVLLDKMKFEDIHIDSARNTYRVIARVKKRFTYPVIKVDSVESSTVDTLNLSEENSYELHYDTTYENKVTLLSYYFTTKIMYGEFEPLKLEAIQVKMRKPVYKYKLSALSTWWVSLSPKWKKNVRNAIDLPDVPTDYYLKRVKGIKKINLKGIKKEELHVLSQFSGIEQLELNDLGLDTLFDFSKFKRLKILSLANNELTSIEALRNCIGLQSLNISGNVIHDISPLARCKNMVGLSFNNNLVEEIGVVKNFQHLRTLKFSNNKVEDISVLKYCLGIKVLDFSKNKGIESLSPIRQLVMMENLNCFNTKIADLEPIKGMVNMHTLNVGFTKIKSLDALKNFQYLFTLNITGDAISDYSVLHRFSKLSRFYCAQANISDISPFMKLKDLKVFTANNTNFTKADIQRLKKKFPRCGITYY